MIVCVRRKKKTFFHAAAALVVLAGLAGCRGFQPRSQNIGACLDENAKLRRELDLKNDRLERFNQLNKDGSLKGGK